MDAPELEIRSAEPADFAALQSLHALPRVIHGTLQVPFTSQEVWRERCTDRPDNVRLLVACAQGEVIGCVGLVICTAVRRRHAGELGLTVHDHWQRRGVGSRLLGAVVELADRWLNLSRLELTVFTDNAPAIALYEKFGFRREGRLERYAFRNGEYTDVFAMARLNAAR